MATQVGVSVIVPCHNAADFLSDALRSVAGQSFSDFECLIIDDGSTDDSVSVAADFIGSDARFRLIELPTNRGAAAARNAGLADACGRWVTLLDADDLYLPDRLERLVALGEARQADMVIDDLIVTKFPNITPLHRAFGFSGERDFSQEDFFRRSRVFRPSMAAGYIQPLMRRDLLDRIGARYDPSVPSGEDFLFYGHLFSTRPRCLATDYAGYVYRQRPGSLSQVDTHLHVHADQSARLAREFGGSLSGTSRKALSDRARDFRRLADAWPALSGVRRKHWLEVAGQLAAHPGIIATGLALLGSKLGRRFGAHFRPGRSSTAALAGDYLTPNVRN